jgi:hypothetical protein
MSRLLAGIALASAAYVGVFALTGDRSPAVAAAWIAALTVWFWAWGPISRQGVEDSHGYRH